MKRILSALICGCLCAPHGAQAKSKANAGARLELSKGPGTEQCLDQRSLSRAVEARLQRRAFRTDLATTLDVQIAITRTRSGWSALLTMHDGSGAFLGRRSLVTEAVDCSALDDSLALIVALLVDSPPPPMVEEKEASPAPAAPSKTTAAPSAPPAVPKSEAKGPTVPDTAIRLPPDTPAPREPWRLQLAAEGSGAIGLLPGFAPGIELGFGAKAPKFPEIRVFAGWYAEQEQRRSGTDEGARFDFAQLGLELCPLEHAFGVAAWFLCAGQSLGRLHVASFGFDENLTSSHLSYALLLRSGLQVAFSSHWAARLGVRAELPLARGVFSYGTREGGQAGLFQSSAVTAVLDLGLVVRL